MDCLLFSPPKSRGNACPIEALPPGGGSNSCSNINKIKESLFIAISYAIHENVVAGAKGSEIFPGRTEMLYPCRGKSASQPRVVRSDLIQ